MRSFALRVWVDEGGGLGKWHVDRGLVPLSQDVGVTRPPVGIWGEGDPAPVVRADLDLHESTLDCLQQLGIVGEALVNAVVAGDKNVSWSDLDVAPLGLCVVLVVVGPDFEVVAEELGRVQLKVVNEHSLLALVAAPPFVEGFEEGGADVVRFAFAPVADPGGLADPGISVHPVV